MQHIDKKTEAAIISNNDLTIDIYIVYIYISMDVIGRKCQGCSFSVIVVSSVAWSVCHAHETDM